MIDWQQVWNQYGAFGVICIFGALAWIDIKRSRAKAEDKVNTTDAQTRKDEAASERGLTEAIVKLAGSIERGNEQARAERNENLSALKEMSGRMAGMTEVVTKSSLTSETLKTDLADVKEKAASFYGAFDTRFEPVARLLNDVATLVRDWDSRFAARNEKVLSAVDAVLDYIKVLELKTPEEKSSNPSPVPDTLETQP